jgi:hypothetical protein
MTYEKPEIRIVEPALIAIQHNQKDDVNTSDAQLRRTIPAYQADE